MSSSIRDAIEGHERTARQIQSFLWTGKPHKSEPIERTPEEMTAFLEELREDSWSKYDSGARAMGWTK